MIADNREPSTPLQHKCVVFLDILGFKELVKSAAKDDVKAQELESSLMKI